jgi:hypothetical protein
MSPRAKAQKFVSGIYSANLLAISLKKIMKKTIWVIVGIIVLAGVFYGGVTYGKGHVATAANTAGTFGTGGSQFTRGGGRTAGGGGFISGQIISKGTGSITLKLDTAPLLPGQSETTIPTGSKIIFVDNSATITKTTLGSLNDLTTGTEVSVSGTANSDGSVTAKSLQIRPQTSTSTTPTQ